KPNPPFQPTKKAEAERQRAVRRIVGRHAYDVSLSYADVNSGPAAQRNGAQRDQGAEERRIVRYESLTYGPTQASPEISFVDTLKRMLPVKHEAVRVFDLVNLDGKQVALPGVPKRAVPFIGKAILVGETQDSVMIDASLAAPVGS